MMLTTHRKVKTKNDIKWEEKFNLLKKYLDEFGEFPIFSTVYKGVNLGNWCDTQRQIYKGNRRGNLTKDKIDKLNSINFIWDINNNYWNMYFDLLKKYLDEFGEFPTSSTVYKGVNLGNWCVAQRQIFAGTKRTSILTKDKIDKLNSINFIWDINNNYWNMYFDLLKKYLDEFGEFPTSSTVYKGVNLGNWCNIQRQIYKGNRNEKLTKDKIDKLNSINFIWDIFEDKWNMYFNLLKEYLDKFGEFPTSSTVYKGVNLGNWCVVQRQIYKGNRNEKLTKDKIDKLNSIGFEWNLR